MAKLRMKKIELIALLKDGKKIIELLQRRGVVEISRNDDEELESTNVTAVVGEFEKFRSTVSQALEILNKYCPEKKSVTEMFESRKEVETDDFGKGAIQFEKIMTVANEIIRSNDEISEAEKSISQMNIKCDILKQWVNLDVPMNFRGTATTKAFIGSVPSGVSLEGMPKGSYREVIFTSKEQTNLFVLCGKDTADETEDFLRKNSFVPLTETESETPKNIIERCRNECKVFSRRCSELEKHIAEFAEHREKLKFAIDYLQMRKDKYSALSSLGFTESTFVLTGYIPEKYTGALQKEIEKKYTVSITFTDPTDEDDVPVLLENSRFSAPVEGITKMYAMPSKSDVDPTPVMSFFYYLFFGMMLSDAGYGLLMLIGTTIVLKKFKLDTSMRKTMTMFRNCGISTLIWGALFGSWFGDIVQVVGREYFGKEIGSIALWFQPLDDPIKLLLYSFALGILHLFLGVGVSFKMAWDDGRKLDAVLDTVPVYMTILGVAPLAA